MEDTPEVVCVVAVGGAGKSFVSRLLLFSYSFAPGTSSLVAYDESGARTAAVPELFVADFRTEPRRRGTPTTEEVKGRLHATRYRSVIQRLAHSKGSILKMSPLTFEDLIAEIYRGLGYVVAKTQQSHDGGVDLILEKTIDGLTHRYLVQCKHRSKPKGTVGVAVVRQLVGVLCASLATAAILVTNGTFTCAAQCFIAECAFRVFGIDRFKLSSLAAAYIARA